MNTPNICIICQRECPEGASCTCHLYTPTDTHTERPDALNRKVWDSTPKSDGVYTAPPTFTVNEDFSQDEN